MNSKFKTIILFSPTSDKTSEFKKQLEVIKYIKIFVTSEIDEVQQIIDQSEQAVILVDDQIASNKIFKGTLSKTKARFKMYYLNWYLTLSKEVRVKLSEQKFTMINSEEIDTVIERVELYFFGKVNIFNNANPPITDTEQKVVFKKGYFTHLEMKKPDWRVLLSSHESDDDIDEMLGTNWDLYLEEILEKAVDLESFKEVRLETAPFHETIYPHFIDGKLTKLSIVHINIDENFASNIMNIHLFLEALPLN